MTPDAAASLFARTRDALDELGTLHDTEPAAAAAMRAIRLTEYTVERFWLPPLARQIDANSE